MGYRNVKFSILWIIFLVSFSDGFGFLPVKTNCRFWDPINVYSNGNDMKMHCIMDNYGQMGVVNTSKVLIQKGHCPIYNRHSKEMDARPCDIREGDCPDNAFESYEVVHYKGCFREKRRRTGMVQGDKDPPTSVSNPSRPIETTPNPHRENIEDRPCPENTKIDTCNTGGIIIGCVCTFLMTTGVFCHCCNIQS